MPSHDDTDDDVWILGSEPSQKDRAKHNLSLIKQELEDPFTILPVTIVLNSISKTIAEDIESHYRSIKIENELDWRDAKDWTDPEWINYESIGMSIAASFVLGQMLITKTISLFKNATAQVGPIAFLPENKNTIMALGQTINPNIEISPIAIIDATANYFKHHNEWPSDWLEKTPNKGPAKPTIKTIKKLGMTLKSPTDNLEIALKRLGAEIVEVSLIATIIEEWRLALAHYLPFHDDQESL